MIRQVGSRGLSRRAFFRWAGGAAAAGMVSGLRRNSLLPIAAAQTGAPDLVLAATDGWISLPLPAAIPPFHPDSWAPEVGLTTYIFGFRDVTGLDSAQIANQKMKAQAAAPMFSVTQHTEFKLKVVNLGLQMRPDLIDATTVHWHGFRDAIPFFDGEPSSSVSVLIGREFTYVYRPHDPGTHIYYDRVEIAEHVHMGRAGLVSVRPAENPKWAYSDPTTAFDREFALLLTEVWTEAHWCAAHIQLPEWTDYRPDCGLLNGRIYPDTITPNTAFDPTNGDPIKFDANGNSIPNPDSRLRYQPLSSLVTCNAGERVLLRFANLGYSPAVMTLPGIKMRIAGEDAAPRRGRDGTDTGYMTNSVQLPPGATCDAIFTAPNYRGGPGYDTYVLYNAAGNGYDGQRTEVRVFDGSLGPQILPNT